MASHAIVFCVASDLNVVSDKIDRKTVAASHFGGFGDPSSSDSGEEVRHTDALPFFLCLLTGTCRQIERRAKQKLCQKS